MSYDHNPGFLEFIERASLPFIPHIQFKKNDVDERHELYRQVAQQVWSPDLLKNEIQ
jgi:hypothetical protein